MYGKNDVQAIAIYILALIFAILQIDYMGKAVI